MLWKNWDIIEFCIYNSGLKIQINPDPWSSTPRRLEIRPGEALKKNTFETMIMK
ncbi:MAG TPA: hypothetical protein VKR32_16365 [Puia sp.]|nr:hypothetical protein [Puia sp.]